MPAEVLRARELECYEEGYTSSVWLENELILRELPKVSEVATNHWVFFFFFFKGVIGHLTLFDFITNPRLSKRLFFLI